jgi:nucleoside-diphosphate-sugar epimerase
MRVLVIGGTGFIGKYVVRRLLGAGHDVALFRRGRTPGDPKNPVLQIHGDRADLPVFGPQFLEFAPQVVLDTIAYVERDALQLVEVFRGVAERLVVVSSQDVYRAYGRFRGTEPGPIELVPYAEHAPLRERFYPYRALAKSPDDELLYYYDKILVERAAAGEPRLPCTILRLPFVYGPGDPQHRLWEYVGRIEGGSEKILLDADKAKWRSTRGYVDNVAQAIARAVVDPKTAGCVYNIGDEPALSEAEWVEAIGRAADWTGRVVFVSCDELPPNLAEPYNYAQDLVADLQRMRTDLIGSEPVPAWEALARTVAWQRSFSPEPRPRWDYAAADSALGQA